MSWIELEFRPTQIINPGWTYSDAELNLAKINTLKPTMTEENCGFGSLDQFLHLTWQAHVKYGAWTKASRQPFFTGWARWEKRPSQSELDRPFWIDSDAILHMNFKCDSVHVKYSVWTGPIRPQLEAWEAGF